MKQGTVAWLSAALLLAALPVSGQTDARGQTVQGVSAAGSLSIPTYHALIIGIDRYEHWTPLRQARADAQEIAKLLQAEYGFGDVRTLYDRQATQASITATLRRLTQELGPQDALLIYYAGHGYYDRLLQKGYWIPSEARAKAGGDPATTEWVGNSDLKEHLEAMKARHVLVVSDSCFSGALMRSATEEIAAKENAWYRRAITMPSRWLLTSGSLEAVPDRSVFAAKFRQAIQYPIQEIFAASDVAGWIRNEVAEATGLQPLAGSIKGLANSPEGEFIFLHRSTGRALIQKQATLVTMALTPPKPASSAPKPLPSALTVKAPEVTLATGPSPALNASPEPSKMIEVEVIAPKETILGELVTWTIRVSNHGSEAMTNVLSAAKFSSGVKPVTTGQGTISGQHVYFHLLSQLEPSQSFVFQVRGVPTEEGASIVCGYVSVLGANNSLSPAEVAAAARELIEADCASTKNKEMRGSR